jgi:hypothetical protein
MKATVIEITPEERAAVERELKETQASHVYKRLMVIKLKAQGGKGNREISEIVGMNVSSVNRILLRLKKEGIQAIVGKRHDHGNRYMSREEEVRFLQAFRQRGDAGQIIEVADIHKAYEKTVGHAVTRSAIYYLLHKHQWRKVMPRSKHPKKASEAEIKEYQKNIDSAPKGSPKSDESASHVSRRGWVWANQ